jgi:hypothetical protein
VFAALAICATTIEGVSLRLSRLSMTATAGAFVSNVASQARTPTAFAQSATCETIGAVAGRFAPVEAVASRFSPHEATLPIAHGLADDTRAALLSLRKKVRDASAARDGGPRKSVQVTVGRARGGGYAGGQGPHRTGMIVVCRYMRQTTQQAVWR